MTEQHTVCKVGDITDRRGKTFEVGETRVAVFRSGDTYHALGDACTHMGASIGEGILADGCAVCPWHGASFNLCSGDPLGPPARGGVGTYPCRVEGDDVIVEA